MSIQALIDDLSTRGVSLTFHNGQIEVSGAREAVSTDLVQRLRSSKVQILKFLTNDLLNRAASGAMVEGAEITAADLYAALDCDDWQDPNLITFDALKGLGRAIQNRRDVLAGQAPIGWTATTNCRNCGLVPTFPGGKDTVLVCPWCLAGVSAGQRDEGKRTGVVTGGLSKEKPQCQEK